MLLGLEVLHCCAHSLSRVLPEKECRVGRIGRWKTRIELETEFDVGQFVAGAVAAFLGKMGRGWGRDL